MGVAVGALAGGAIAGSALHLRGAITRTPAHDGVILHVHGASATVVQEVQDYTVHGLPSVSDLANAYGEALFEDFVQKLLI